MTNQAIPLRSETFATSDRSLKTRAMKGAMWYGGSRLAIQVVMWVMTLMVARLLTKVDYGLFGMAVMYTVIVDMLNELGLGAAIIQKRELENADLHTLFWFGVVMGGFFYGVTVLMAPLVARFFHQPPLVGLLNFLGLNFVVSSLRMVPWNLQTRDLDFKKRSLAEVLGNVAGAIGTLTLAYREWGVWALAWGVLLRNTVMTIQVYWESRWQPRLCFHWSRLRGILPFSMHAMGTRITWIMNENSAPFIIGKLLGENALGIYSLACRFTIDLSGRFLAIANQVAFPVYAQVRDDPARFRHYYLTVGQITCTLNYAILSGMMLVADDLIPLALTERWREAVPVFQLLCPVAMLLTTNGLHYGAWLASGKARLAVRYNLLCAVIMSASFCFGAKFGVAGICWGWILTFPTLLAISATVTCRIVGFGLRDYWAMLKPAVLASLALVIVGYCTKTLFPSGVSPAVRLVVVIPVGAVVYLAVIFLVSPRLVSQAGAIRKSFASNSTE